MPEVDSIGASSPSLVNSRQGLADNFEMFLTLLTEQMKNQDPLDPLDSTQFVNQLVDFSGVEQQIAQNQNLESLLLLQSAAAQSASVGYIGREATALSTSTALSENSAQWTYIMPREATNATLVVRDEAGRTVAQFAGETEAGSHTFDWDGKDASGIDMPEGVYTLEVLATDIDGETVTPDIRSRGRVTGIDLSGSEVVIEMGGIRVPLSSVLSLQEYVAPQTVTETA